MTYFKNISDLEQAKKQYRKLAMQLHPDKGGSGKEFDKMQQEYKQLLLELQNKKYNPSSQLSDNDDILKELGKLAKVLIDKKVPQKFLKRKVQNSQSSLERKVILGIVDFLDSL